MKERVFRVASVSYLNSRPLIWGIDRDPRIKLDLAVPSKLIDYLRDGTSDLALLPTIDYQRLPDLKIVPSGGIGSDGETLTVRIFSRCPIEQIRTLACDTDSHTSVALARIILVERYGLKPEFIDLTRATGRDGEARLLIGDKVVCQEPSGFPHQYDLGEEWKKLTSLPFVFAVWTARAGADLGDLPEILSRAREEGMRHIHEIVEADAIPRGWTSKLAFDYLTKHLKFEIGQQQLEAIERFHTLAAKHGIIASQQPLRLH
jgi:chorismate dehydratase